jgi:hypothetical protein
MVLHGLDISKNPVLIDTVEPRVAVFNNGAKKGCNPAVMTALRRVLDVQAIYQLYRNLTVGAQENTEPDFFANADEKCQGEGIRLSVAADSKTYTLSVGERGKPKRHETRQRSVRSQWPMVNSQWPTVNSQWQHHH